MTHWGHRVKSLQQMLPFAFRSRPWLARTLNFADVIAMALGPASKYIIRYMPGPCVGRLTSISCCSTDPVAVLFVNGCYFQILVAMFNIGALRCSRNCPRSATPRVRPHVGSTSFCSSLHTRWASLLCVLFLLARFLFVRANPRGLVFWCTAMYHESLLTTAIPPGVLATS